MCRGLCFPPPSAVKPRPRGSVRGAAFNPMNAAGGIHVNRCHGRIHWPLPSVIISVMGEPQPDSGLVGRTLGPYRILESLGSGGMGHVYLAAATPRLDRRVALKVLPPEMASHPEKIKRFEREAKAVASLSHPGIVMLCTPSRSRTGSAS